MSSQHRRRGADPLLEPKRATTSASRASLRLLPLLALGIVLIAAALFVRSSHAVREPILRGKDLTELEALVHDHPDDALAQYYLAKKYYLNRRFKDAKTAYEAAARLEPDSARSHLGLALTLYELRQTRQAQTEFTEALRHDAHLAWAEYMLGKIAWSRGNVAEALPHLKRATELDPRADQAWYGLSVCYSQLNRRPEALDALRQAVARRPDNPRYLTTLGELCAYLGKTDEGRQHYEHALQLDPNYGPACALLGSLILQTVATSDALDRAEHLLLRATQLPTYHPQDVYLDLGELYMRRGQTDKAIAALQAAVRADPRDERPLYRLAKAYRKAGNNKAAEEADTRFHFISKRHVEKDDLEKRLSQNPRDAALRLRLARTYRDLGLTQQALQQYLAYRDLQPDSEEVTPEFQEFVQAQINTSSSKLDQDFVTPRLRQP